MSKPIFVKMKSIPNKQMQIKKHEPVADSFYLTHKVFLLSEFTDDKGNAASPCDCCICLLYFISDNQFIAEEPCINQSEYSTGMYSITNNKLLLDYRSKGVTIGDSIKCLNDSCTKYNQSYKYMYSFAGNSSAILDLQKSGRTIRLIYRTQTGSLVSYWNFNMEMKRLKKIGLFKALGIYY